MLEQVGQVGRGLPPPRSREMNEWSTSPLLDEVTCSLASMRCGVAGEAAGRRRPAAPSSVAEKKQRLAVAPPWRHDPLDLEQEPHVDHPVGLVEDGRRTHSRSIIRRPEQVDQPARGCNHDLAPPRSAGPGLSRAGAAVADGDADAAGCGRAARGRRDLLGELAGGAEDERLGGGRLGVGEHDQREAEREGLTLPVRLFAITSVPSRPAGMHSHCTANGSVMGARPARRTPPRSRRGPETVGHRNSSFGEPGPSLDAGRLGAGRSPSSPRPDAAHTAQSLFPEHGGPPEAGGIFACVRGRFRPGIEQKGSHWWRPSWPGPPPRRSRSAPRKRGSSSSSPSSWT